MRTGKTDFGSSAQFADWCVVNVAIGQWYSLGQERMVASLRAHGFKGQTLLWKNELPPGCPAHADTPYAFKIWAIQEARRRGYSRVAWLDSSLVAVNPLSTIRDWLKRQPFFVAAYNGNQVGQWSSDAALAWFGVDREIAMQINGLETGLAFFDLTQSTACRVLERWHAAALAGTPFRGCHRNDLGQVSRDSRVLGHRHDQTALSLIVWQEKLPVFRWAHAITRHAKRYRLREDTVFVCRRKCYGFETHGRVGTPLWRLLYHPRNALRRLLGQN